MKLNVRLEGDVEPLKDVKAPRNSRTVRRYGLEAHNYLKRVTHVDSGAYRAAQSVRVEGTEFLLYVNPGSPAADYARYEEKRGGEHAAYERTFREYILRHADQIMDGIARETLGE